MDLSNLPPAAVAAIKAGIEKQLDTAHTLHTVILGVICWELLVCLKAEIKYVWKKPGFMSLCYMFNRYWSLTSFTIVYWMEQWSTTPETCSKAARFVNGGPIVTFVAASILVINRVFSIYGKDMRVLALLCTILLATFVLQVVTVVKTESNALYAALDISACTPSGDNPFFYPYFISIIVLDVVAVLLAAVKVYSAWKQCKTRLVQTLLVDSLFWLVVCTAANLANIIYWAVTPVDSNRALLSSLPCVAQSIAACRMLLAIRASAEKSASGLSYPSNVSSGPRSKATGTSNVPQTPLTPVAFPEEWSNELEKSPV